MTAAQVMSSHWIAGVGSPSARLLAGPSEREDLAQHRERVGPSPDHLLFVQDPLEALARSGLTGRGGGHFPLVRKLVAAREAPGVPVVLVNATESEPASRKDQTLAQIRPHLLLDGARCLARVVGADRIIVATHERSPGYGSIDAACTEIREEGAQVEVACVPDRYIAGESSALIAYINGGPAVPPSRILPSAVSGVAGRPTVVSNAETVSHAGQILRNGAEWFRSAGSDRAPGSVLVTVSGDVRYPGTVLEVSGPASISEVIDRAGGASDAAQAVLLGGYGGQWISAQQIRDLPLDQASLQDSGLSLGCGLIGVLGTQRCGLAEAAHLLRWLVGQRAGQCGACSVGLPDLLDWVEEIATGTRWMGSAIKKVMTLVQSIAGRGLCHLPDGAISMVESAMEVFAVEIQLHGRRRCSGREGPVFPLPTRPEWDLR